MQLKLFLINDSDYHPGFKEIYLRDIHEVLKYKDTERLEKKSQKLHSWQILNKQQKLGASISMSGQN